MSHNIKSLRFGQWHPDDSDLDTLSLLETKNAMPLFASYRSVRKKSILSTEDLSDATTGLGQVTGGIVHSYTQDISEQTFQVIDDDTVNSDGNWSPVGVLKLEDEDEAEGWEAISEVFGDDTDRIVAYNAPSVEQARYKLTVDDIETPAAGARKIFYRYRIKDSDGSWTLKVKVQQGDGTLYGEEFTESGTEDTDGWVQSEQTLTGTGTITDWTDLRMHVKTTVPGAGIAEYYCDEDLANGFNWTGNGDEEEDLFELVDGDAPTEDTYMISSQIAVGQESAITLGLPEVEDPVTLANHELSFDLRATQSEVNAEVALMQGSFVIAIKEIEDEIPLTWTSYTLDITENEWATIGNLDDLRVRVRFYVDEDAPGSGSTSNLYPKSDHTVSPNNSWQPIPAWSQLGDDSESITSDGNVNDRIRFSIDSTTAPDDTEGFKLVVKAKSNSGFPRLRPSLFQGSDKLHEFDIDLTDTYDTYEEEIPEDVIEGITNWGNLKIQLFSVSGEGIIEVERFHLELPSGRQGECSTIKLTTADPAQAEFSWFKMTTPKDDSVQLGEFAEIYVGTENGLFSVDGSGFTDVSKTGSPSYQDLSTFSEEALAWDFVSYGDDVIATNGLDPVQVRSPGDSQFSDLITGTHKPVGAHLAVVGTQLVQGKIRYTGSLASGSWNEVWWHGIDDATDADPDPTTLAGRQVLRERAGEITFIKGGEYGIIGRPSSIYKMEWVGSPEAYSFKVLSPSIGTRYSKSAVQYFNNVYFFSDGGFWVVRSGNTVEPIGDQIMRAFIDEEFEQYAIKRIGVTNPRDKALTIVGCADQISGQLLWVVRGKADPLGRCRRVLCYNAAEDRWSIIEDDELYATLILSQNTASVSSSSILRDVVGISQEPDSNVAEYFKFSSGDTYPSTFETHIISRQYLDDQLGMNAKIIAVRPMFRGRPVSTDPNVEITVKSANDERFSENLSECVVDSSVRNRDGWYPVNRLDQGEFFSFKIEIPSMNLATMRDLDGIQIKYAHSGGF